MKGVAYHVYRPPTDVNVTVRWRGDLWLVMVNKPGWTRPKVAEVEDFLDVPDHIEVLVRS